MLGQNFVWAIEATDNIEQYSEINVRPKRKEMLSIGGRKFSSSGRAGAIEINKIKWNRRCSYLVPSNFELSFYLVLI